MLAMGYVMNDIQARQVRFYLRLNYPLAVTCSGDGFVAHYLDLPGCEAFDTDLPRLHHSMDSLRRRWIQEHVLSETPVPLPNSHLVENTTPQLHPDTMKGPRVPESAE